MSGERIGIDEILDGTALGRNDDLERYEGLSAAPHAIYACEYSTH
jgi:hypothetical protein